MALLIKRDCGLGSDFTNYVKIQSIAFHIALKQEYHPFCLWEIAVVCYLNKDARSIERLQQVTLLESELNDAQLKKYREVRSRVVKPVGEIKLEVVTPLSFIKELESSESLYSYFYLELKTKYSHIFGASLVNIQDELFDSSIEDLVDEVIYGNTN